MNHSRAFCVGVAVSSSRVAVCLCPCGGALSHPAYLSASMSSYELLFSSLTLTLPMTATDTPAEMVLSSSTNNSNAQAMHSPPEGHTQSPPILSSNCQHHQAPTKRSSLFQSPSAPQAGPFIIGVAGASASGKTTVCRKITDGLGDLRCVLISFDWFYYGLPANTDAAQYNFDHPDAFDFKALLATLSAMEERRPISVPTYDFSTHRRAAHKSVELHAADVIIIEGILAFYDPSLRRSMHLKIFVDEDADICLSRRIQRDAAKRGRSIQSILDQYTRFVKPAFEEFILPTKRYADIVLPRGAENLVAIDLIIKHIALKLKQDDLRKVYSNLIVMADSYQARGLHTILRNETTQRTDFVFYANRLMRLLIEEALGLLPFHQCTVRTTSGGRFHGVEFVGGLAAVSLMPGGETMQTSLRDVCNLVQIGKIMTGDNEFNKGAIDHLPDDMANKYVLLLAPVLNGGAECELALERLTRSDVGCCQDRVLVVCVVASPKAVQRICSRFTGVRMVVSAVDEGVDQHGNVYPGIGQFTNRYYGCE